MRAKEKNPELNVGSQSGPTEQSLPCTGISLQMAMGDHPRERGPGELEHLQEPSLPG